MSPSSKRTKKTSLSGRRRLVVGLTGGIGSGKSTVLRMFRRLGCATADADAIAHRALEPGGPTYARVKRLFGPEIVGKDRQLNRARIADLVFRAPSLRRRLEHLVHPIVLRELDRRIRRVKKGVLVLDIPLLFEGGYQSFVDTTAVVWCSRARRLRRLRRRGKFSLPDIRRRMDSQIPLSQKRHRAAWVIDNNGALSQTRLTVERMVRLFKKLLKERL
ncbi:MAG TPA: dephospho-CoA kinase [Elusimicrobiota bacterium]|nr:dephospho-CoA kinase [Elusimicrobiota bacterium]